MVKIFVGNLESGSKSADLRKKFEKFGKVTECDVVNNYAFVHMESEANAKSAIADLHNSDFDGVKINVEMSHGKRASGTSGAGGPGVGIGGGGAGGGPMRRRYDQGRSSEREYPPDRYRGPPRAYGEGMPPGPRGGVRFGQPSWDDGYGGAYGPPPMRDGPCGGYEYQPMVRYDDREMGMRMPREPRGPPQPQMREMMHDQVYRAPLSREPAPAPVQRDYPVKQPSLPVARPRYDGYEGYSEGYERYREAPAQSGAMPNPSRNDYYDNYGSYGTGATAAVGGSGGYDYPEYRDSRPPNNGAPAAPSYEYGNYYDYERDSRAVGGVPQQQQPSRGGYYAR